MKILKKNKALIVLIMFCHSFFLFSQEKKDIAKSIRANVYGFYISDNTINSQGMNATLEFFNYHFSNTSSLSVLSMGSKNKYYAGQNVFSGFTKGNAKIKIPLTYVKGESEVNEIVKLFWDPKKKMWSPANTHSPFPPKDTLIVKNITDRFFVTGLGLSTYRNLVNIGAEAYLITKSGNYPDRNIQVSLVSSLFRQRKISALVHADLIYNQRYFAINTGRLYYLEGELTAKTRLITFAINYGFGKSIFRYSMLDNGYLEFAPVMLKYQYGIKGSFNLPSLGSSLFFSLSQSYYHPPNDQFPYTSFYAGIKIPIKKY